MFSSSILESLAGSNNKTDKDRLTEEKCTNFIKFLYLCESFHKKLKTQRSDQNRQYLSFLDKQ